jgi:hypothetical protein
MTQDDILTLTYSAGTLIGIAVNVSLYLHLASTMRLRFDSLDRRFEAFERRLDSILSRLSTKTISW